MAEAKSRLRRPLQLQTYTRSKSVLDCEWFSIAGPGWQLQVVRSVARLDPLPMASHLLDMAKTPTAPPRPMCRLYLITPSVIPDLTAFASDLQAALAAGDVAAVQIRLKDADDAVVLSAVAALAPVARSRGVAVILNDRPDLARRS